MAATIVLDDPQAGFLLAASVSLADDNPSQAEIVVIRKYYASETILLLETRIREAGLVWPHDLPKLESAFLARLKQSTGASRLRSLAVALELAQADGQVDQEEMRLLARYAETLGVSLSEADRYMTEALREIDSTGDYGVDKEVDLSKLAFDLELSPRETTAALVTLIAVADDKPSEKEMALVREYCELKDFEGLSAKLTASGGRWPGDLPRCRPSILRGLRTMDRKGQLRSMTLAYRTAVADGEMDPRELDLLNEFCTSLQIGLGELEACAPALESLFRSE